MLKSIPLGFKILIRKIFFPSFYKRVFCISMQRTGTTSVGDFLVAHGYRVARWDHSLANDWTYKIDTGNYDAVFKSKIFNSFNAFEDAPWFYGNLYRYLFHKFHKSKFILLTRDSNAWFDSMVKHSDGKTLGNTYIHCELYRRLGEYYNNLDNNHDFKPSDIKTDNLMKLEENKRQHYISIYEEYNRDVQEYFKKYAPERLFVGRLEDPDKWQKLGKFLEKKVAKDYDVHSNKSQH